eukprot:5306797-Prorocentrum_lima.AAC.1
MLPVRTMKAQGASKEQLQIPCRVAFRALCQWYESVSAQPPAMKTDWPKPSDLGSFGYPPDKHSFKECSGMGLWLS